MTPPEVQEDPSGLPMLAVGALLAGAVTGLLGSLFRMALDATHGVRGSLIDWARQWPSFGWLVPVVGAAVAAALARALVRISPLAAGSGVQHVEAVARGQSEPAGFPTIPVKFAGGILAIGSGLALGREGPSVQMGAVLGHQVGRLLRLPARDQVLLLTAAAGSGLGVAFNAPTGGAMFVFEEVWHAFRLRL
ncbi:MAG: chloride channel protein, partial [Deltaproteobacteria bacterium]